MDLNNTGVANVIVTADGKTSVTDGSGYFIIKDLESGSHKISAALEGASFVKSEFTVVLDDINFYDYKVFRLKN